MIVMRFFEHIHVHSVFFILGACLLMVIESVAFSLRLWVLIPRSHGIRALEIIKLYYKSVLISQLSYATIADIYRFRALQKLCPEDLHVGERIEWIGIEKISEPLTLFILGFALVSGNDIYQYIPKKIFIPFLIILIAVAVYISVQRYLEKKKSKPRSVSFRAMGLVVFLSAFGWCLDLSAIKLLTLEYSLSWSKLMLTLLALSMASVPPLPWGRWGLFEAVMSGTLHSFGVPIEQALFIATAFHILMFVPVGGFFGGLWIYKRTR